LSPVIERKKVKEMFSNIAPTYDLLNHSLSFGLDFYWRKRAVRLLFENSISSPVFLDIATGTGDVVLEIFRQSKFKINKSNVRVYGLDFAFPMLGIGKSKIVKRLIDCDFIQGDALSLPFQNASFDGIIISFGFRNFESRGEGLAEISRVIRPGGKIVILEFGNPVGIWGVGFNFYFKCILPMLGRIFSGHREAYSYLPATVSEFLSPDETKNLINQYNFEDVNVHSMTGGVANIFVGTRT
tara:strand:+ start:4189 stop:4911 length:723 start_codon:yes stop_codon:yes gene_type:complete